MNESGETMLEDSDPCWKGYKMVGMKNKNGRKVPNCVPGEGVPDMKKEEADEKFKTPPFAGPYKKITGNVEDKSGAVHTPLSRAKDLAKKAARKQAGLKEENDVDRQGYEKTNTPAKRSLSKTAGMVKDMVKSSKNKDKKTSPEKFEPEPELASAINR